MESATVVPVVVTKGAVRPPGFWMALDRDGAILQRWAERATMIAA